MVFIVGALIFGYLLGSIPFGLLLTRFAGTQDLRTVGSGNIGATNVLRTGRKDLAAATLILDALKGTAAVLLAAPFGPYAWMAAGFGAFLGHLFPVWLKFQGGKGVATFLGVLLGIWWPAFLVAIAIWLGIALTSRYSSLAALVTSIATPIVLALSHLTGDGAMFAVMAALLWWKHAPNIARLRDGSESRIGAKG